MLTVTLLLWVVSTLDLALGLRHNLEAFVYYSGPGGPTAVFLEISSWINIMKTMTYVAQTFIGDGILIYRCYIVYGRNWKIIIPSVILWLGGTVCGCLVAATYATLKSAALIDVSNAVPFVDGMASLSLSMNVLTTGLIVWKIWSIDKQTSAMFSTDRRRSKLHRAMRITIDSAALYTISIFIFVMTYVTGSNANYATSDMVVQVVGISFNLIIIRVGNKRSNGNTIPSTQQNTQRKLQHSFPLSSFRHGSSQDDSETTTKGVTMDVEIVHDYDSTGKVLVSAGAAKPHPALEFEPEF